MSWLTLDRRYLDKMKADPKLDMKKRENQEATTIGKPSEVKLKHVEVGEKQASSTPRGSFTLVDLKHVEPNERPKVEINGRTSFAALDLNHVDMVDKPAQGLTSRGSFSTVELKHVEIPEKPSANGRTSNLADDDVKRVEKPATSPGNASSPGKSTKKTVGFLQSLGASLTFGGKKKKKESSTSLVDDDEPSATDVIDTPGEDNEEPAPVADASENPTVLQDSTVTTEERRPTVHEESIVPQITTEPEPVQVIASEQPAAPTPVVDEQQQRTPTPPPVTVTEEPAPVAIEEEPQQPTPTPVVVVEESNTPTQQDTTVIEQPIPTSTDDAVPPPTAPRGSYTAEPVSSPLPPPPRGSYVLPPPPLEDEMGPPPPPEAEDDIVGPPPPPPDPDAPMPVEKAVFDKILDSRRWRVRLPVTNSYVLEALVLNPDPFVKHHITIMTATQVSAVVEALYFKPNVMLKQAKNFFPLKTDVIVSGVPRVGQSPVIQILDALRQGHIIAGDKPGGSGGFFERTNKGALLDRVPWIEAPYGFTAAPSLNRLLKSYLDLHLLAGNNTQHHHKINHKIVCVLRDPLDLRMSWYRHVRRVYRKCAMTKELLQEFDERFAFHDFEVVPLSTGVVRFTWDESHSSTYEDYVSDVLHLQERSPHQICLVFYEELITAHGIARVVDRLKQFTGWTGNGLKIKQIVEAVTGDKNHPLNGLRVGSAGAGITMSILQDTRRMDEYWELRVHQKHKKHESYLALYEKTTGTAFEETGLKPRENWFVEYKKKDGRAVGSPVNAVATIQGVHQVHKVASMGVVPPTPAVPDNGPQKHTSTSSLGPGRRLSSMAMVRRTSALVMRGTGVKSAVNLSEVAEAARNEVVMDVETQRSKQQDPDDRSDEEFGFVDDNE